MKLTYSPYVAIDRVDIHYLDVHYTFLCYDCLQDDIISYFMRIYPNDIDLAITHKGAGILPEANSLLFTDIILQLIDVE